MKNLKKVGSFRAVPVKSIGVVGEGAVDFTEIEEALVLVKQKNRNYQLTQTSYRRWMKNSKRAGSFGAVPVKSIEVVGEGAVDFTEMEEALV